MATLWFRREERAELNGWSGVRMVIKRVNQAKTTDDLSRSSDNNLRVCSSVVKLVSQYNREVVNCEAGIFTASVSERRYDWAGEQIDHYIRAVDVGVLGLNIRVYVMN